MRDSNLGGKPTEKIKKGRKKNRKIPSSDKYQTILLLNLCWYQLTLQCRNNLFIFLWSVDCRKLWTTTRGRQFISSVSRCNLVILVWSQFWVKKLFAFNVRRLSNDTVIIRHCWPRLKVSLPKKENASFRGFRRNHFQNLSPYQFQILLFNVN